ncbi:fatty acid desaturase [Candidatus Obscuribacterales bacterium]|nr:fatty acid desaturase [Candidatus Obscuribacterales bacterium]MBX3137095.1 fatty acid desaturase [Candidatus Obscuribacterales bacterium]MBX3151266.1 fatty acid desaturase [Candidatus Obscuribacterales bacterium]
MENPVLFCTLTLVFYLYHTLGVTVGLHRLLSHRAFKCPKAVEYFFVSGAYLAFHGAPIWWATIHRNHHRYVETKLDPHSPKNGILQAYFFYRDFKYPPHMNPEKQCPDLWKDPVYRWLERGDDWRLAYVKCVTFGILFRVLLWACFGTEVMLASFLAGFLAWNMPLILNIMCHIPKLGYRNFAVADDSVNNHFFGIVALGDGWHNNHHAHPGSSQMGLKKHEFDFSWFVLKCLQKVGLVYTINESMRADKTNELAIAEDADEAMDEFEREHKLESEREADLAASGHRTHKPFRQSASSRSKSRQ